MIKQHQLDRKLIGGSFNGKFDKSNTGLKKIELADGSFYSAQVFVFVNDTRTEECECVLFVHNSVAKDLDFHGLLKLSYDLEHPTST